MDTLRFTLLALAAVTTGVTPALAQSTPRAEVALLAGPSPYDLSGTGTGFAMKAGFARRLGTGVFVIEPSLGYFRYTDQGQVDRTWLLPEVGVQVRPTGGAVRPFVGIGAGLGFESGSVRSRTEPTLHVLAGLMVPVAGGWSARGEMRLRSVSPWSGNMADIGFGVSRAIGLQD